MSTYKDLDSKFIYERLICFWIFPISLEKILSSKNFWTLVLSEQDNPIFIHKKTDRFSVLKYKLTRNTNAPRLMWIPHPLSYLFLSNVIRDSWDDIKETIFQGNNLYDNISMIIPQDYDDYRLIKLWWWYWETETISYSTSPSPTRLVLNENREQFIELEKSIGAKFVMHTDISGCFSNIYTHSIPWAVIWKDKAKNEVNDRKNWKENSTNWYNVLDKANRIIKNNETNWLPIWPDTSHIISELILSQVDRELVNKWYNYIRYIDDYKCYCKTKEEADDFIKDISIELWKYQLELNTKKTFLHDLPNLFSSEWTSKLRNYTLPTEISKKDLYSVLDLLDIAVKYSKEKWDYTPFKYALQRIKYLKYDDLNLFVQVFNYIAHVTFLHPYIIDIFDTLIENTFKQFPWDKLNCKDLFSTVINNILIEHIPYGRSDVITHSLHIAIKYDLKLDNFSTISWLILWIDDPLPTLMSFLYTKHKWLELDETYFNKINTIDQEEWWLYIYELYVIDKEKVKVNINGEFLYNEFYDYLDESWISFIDIDYSEDAEIGIEDIPF